MTRIRGLAFSVTMIVVIASNCITLGAQATSSVSQSSSISVSVAMESNRALVGQEVKAILTMKNIGSGIAVETGDPRNYRLHVKGEAGEPPKTLWHRRLLGEPGLSPLEVTLPAFPRDILPGKSINRTFLLTAFYDLSVPGKYLVYLEARDESGDWLHTNTATFEVQAPPR
jgi:hypothetical protein